jgi:spoIIIJ-associated protein
MEWVETTGKTLDEAMERALDRLGIGPDDAEFDVIEEPRTGLFGRVRGEARVRARVKPATVRPKQDRRNRRRSDSRAPQEPGAGDAGRDPGSSGERRRNQRRDRTGETDSSIAILTNEETAMSDNPTTDDSAAPPPSGSVDVDAVARAAEEFSAGLLNAFGVSGSASSTAVGNEIDVRIEAQGDGLGLLIGPGGRTLLAIQDLARVAAQRRLGDHETRLRIDIAGYREKRRVALERFSRHVAELVKESNIARSLDPMPSADRKVVHDTLAGIDGVVTRSEGEEPNRRIIVAPAAPATTAG